MLQHRLMLVGDLFFKTLETYIHHKNERL